MGIEELHHLFLNSKGVSTDTRTLRPGNLFFALKGINFNANKFAKKALKLGASYSVVDEKSDSHSEQLILVDDVLKSLQKLAAFHRKYLGIPIIALTGSNGKTTTKELISSALSHRYNIHSTDGNLNNHIGVPLTLLQMDESTEIGVVEMGANHIGEIAALCEIASPTHGYITNFGKAHLEGFGSESGVIKGKSELYNYLKVRDGLIFANKDDTIQLKQIGSYKNIYTFSNYSRSSDLQLSKSLNRSFLKLEYDGFSIQSQLIGSYNFSNLAASILIARFFEVKNQIIKKGIESYNPENNRSQIIKKGSNTFILDAYNANPSSMLAALENFNQMKSKSKAIILGDMFELGIQSNFEHQALIDKVTSLNFSRVYFVGANFYELAPDLSNELFFETTESFQKKLKSLVFKDTLVLIKGSRGMALETLLEFF